MANRNVSISSLLAETQDETERPKASVRNLVSRFQTSIKVGGPDSPIVIVDDDKPPFQSPSPSATPTPAGSGRFSATSSPSHNRVLAIRPSPVPSKPDGKKAALVSSHIKSFQTNFNPDPPNRTSINSIINIESSPETESKSPEKKKKPVRPPVPAKRKSPEEDPAKKKRPAPKPKKTPEVLPVQEKIELAPPSILEVVKGESKEAERGKKELEKKEKERKDLPIIALNIPLIDPKNPKGGQSEVIVNVLKLAEDKYGWAALHPDAKNAIDVMDDLIEDDDDVEEDDDELVEIDAAGAPANTSATMPASLPATKSKSKKEDELTEEQLVRRHEAKMNRKVGKYDYEDPFIDDDELQWEEDVSSTKEGFFVYWGPLIDERHPVAIKKAPKKR